MALFGKNSGAVGDFLLDLFFPKNCVGCGREETYLCEDCFKKIQIEIRSFSGYSHLDDVWAAGGYDDPILQKLIHLLKYDFITELSRPLGRIIIRPLSGYFGQSWILMPVPLHRKRQLERGFNQAELLANAVGDFYHWPVLTDVLCRRKYTKPQAKLKKDRRLINLKNVFACRPSEEIKGKNILLVDDVMTTGATLDECAKVLKQAGAGQVRGLVIAHG